MHGVLDTVNRRQIRKKSWRRTVLLRLLLQLQLQLLCVPLVQLFGVTALSTPLPFSSSSSSSFAVSPPLLPPTTTTTTTPTTTNTLTRVDLSQLVSNECDAWELIRAGLRRDHVILVSLDDPKDQTTIAELWKATATFFALPDQEQARFGPLMDAESSINSSSYSNSNSSSTTTTTRDDDHHHHHLGHARLVGYTHDDHDNRFLDLRIHRRNSNVNNNNKNENDEMAGRTGGDRNGTLELLPCGLDNATLTVGVERALAQGAQVLMKVGLAALYAATAELSSSSSSSSSMEWDDHDEDNNKREEEDDDDDKDARKVAVDIGTFVDQDEDLMNGATSATVHRLVSYGAATVTANDKHIDDKAINDKNHCETAKNEAIHNNNNNNNVAFAPHTDGTFFTVVPCALVPGLEVQSSSSSSSLLNGGWFQPEVQGRPIVDVAVLTGDFLQSWSQWEFPSATHRVIRPPPYHPSRHSAPLLMRPSPNYYRYSSSSGGILGGPQRPPISEWQAAQALEASASSSQFAAARLKVKSARCAHDRAAEASARALAMPVASANQEEPCG
jgi:isopenicillin N synthase-like dioxygenase